MAAENDSCCGKIEIRTVTVRELHCAWPAIEERLRAGQPHLVTNHGKAVAIIAPMTQAAPFSAKEFLDLSVRLLFQASRMPR